MELVKQADLDALMEFLPCATPQAWIDEALKQEEILLQNHCYLEQCAARNALQLMFRCPDKPDVLSLTLPHCGHFPASLFFSCHNLCLDTSEALSTHPLTT